MANVAELYRHLRNKLSVTINVADQHQIEEGPFLKAGQNELRVEVSNLGANAIPYLDKEGVYWKKFHNTNIVDIDYKPFDASDWDILPSGLNGKVELIQLKPGAKP